MPGTDVFDEAEKQQGDVFDQAAKSSPASINDPLVTGKGMIENAQRQNIAAAKNKITSAQPNYAAQMLENSPSGADPHNPGNPNLNAVPESERPELSRRMATIASLTTPGTAVADEIAGGARAAPILMKAGRGIIGAGVGSSVGGAAGSIFGPVGKAIGSVGGGLLGGGMAAGLERNPITTRIKSLPFGIQRAIPEWMVPGGVPDEELARGAFMNKGYSSAIPEPAPPVDELAQAIREGRAARIPTTMPKSLPETDPLTLAVREGRAARLPVTMPRNVTTPDELSLAVREGRASRLPTRMPTPEQADDPLSLAVREGRAARIPVRMPRTGSNLSLPPIGTPESVAGTRSLVLTPSEAASEDVMQQIAKRRASQRGMQFAGGMTPREGRKVPRLPTRMSEEELPGPREKIVFPDEEDEEQ